MDLLFGAVIIVVLAGALWTVFGKKRSSNGTGPIGGGGTIDGGSTGPGDGSVTPPKNGPDAE